MTTANYRGTWLNENRADLCAAAGRGDDAYGLRRDWHPQVRMAQRHFLPPGGRLVERLKARQTR
jgi:hypothetical protein